jgi:hypothetical protein
MLGSIFNSQVERESSPLPARRVQIGLASADIDISNFQPDALPFHVQQQEIKPTA